jgi:hypothetical protein
MNTYNIKLFFLTVISSFILTGCLKDDLNSPNVPQAGFTMINVYTGANSIIHKADNNFIQTMNNPLPFKGINFVYLYPGNRKIQTIDPSNKILIDSTYAIKDSLLYTSIVFDKADNKVGQRVVSDTLLNNLSTNAAFRFVNLASDMINVDLYIGDTEVITNRSYDGNTLVTSNYKFVSQSSGNKKIIIKNNANETLAEKDLNMLAGMHYSFVLIKHTTENKYELVAHQQYRN